MLRGGIHGPLLPLQTSPGLFIWQKR